MIVNLFCCLRDAKHGCCWPSQVYNYALYIIHFLRVLIFVPLCVRLYLPLEVLHHQPLCYEALLGPSRPLMLSGRHILTPTCFSRLPSPHSGAGLGLLPRSIETSERTSVSVLTTAKNPDDAPDLLASRALFFISANNTFMHNISCVFLVCPS